MDHDYTKYRELKPDDVVLILGAYDGDFIRERKSEIFEKNVFVICIEPDIRLCQIGMEFVRKELPLNATFLNMAVSDKTGISFFQNCNNHLISSLHDLPRSWPDDEEFSTKILTMTLDNIIDLYNPNCIFCDIEGAELEVFMSSKFFSKVEYIAIAAYHGRDFLKTYVRLLEYFSQNILKNAQIIIDGGDNNEEVLYII